MYKKKQKSTGFTIVELLIVIVVISVLTTIAIVSYTGIRQKAIIASLQADLANASIQLKLFQVENSYYPATLSTNCDLNPNTTSNLCIKPTLGNIFDYKYVDPQTYSFDASSGSTKYRVTNLSSIPILVTSTPITAIAAITGTSQVGSVLSSGNLTPSSASESVSYQWLISSTLDGTYTEITGATNNTYTLVSNDISKYLKVTATGTGNYTGTVTSGSTGQITTAGVLATGGTVTELGGFRIHTFTANGILGVTNGGSITITANGGGGGGGSQDNVGNVTEGINGDKVVYTITVNSGDNLNIIIGQGGNATHAIDGGAGGSGYNYGSGGSYGSGYSDCDGWAYGGGGGGGSSAAIKSSVRLVESKGGSGGRSSDYDDWDCNAFWNAGSGGAGGGLNFPTLTTQFGGGNGGVIDNNGNNGSVSIKYLL